MFSGQEGIVSVVCEYDLPLPVGGVHLQKTNASVYHSSCFLIFSSRSLFVFSCHVTVSVGITQLRDHVYDYD